MGSAFCPCQTAHNWFLLTFPFGNVGSAVLHHDKQGLRHNVLFLFTLMWPQWWGWEYSPAVQEKRGATLCSSNQIKKILTSLALVRFEFFVVWTIQINEDGKVWPKLDLLTKVPKQGRGPQDILFLAQCIHILYLLTQQQRKSPKSHEWLPDIRI